MVRNKLVTLHHNPRFSVARVTCPPFFGAEQVIALCQELKIPTIVYSTHKDAWWLKNVKRNTDKDGAYELAQLASMDQLNPTHVPRPEMRGRRRLIKFRKLIDHRIENTIRALFVSQGTQISNGTLRSLWLERF